MSFEPLDHIEESLRSMGYKTQRSATRLVILLPLYCSVVVQDDGDSVRCTPWFGFVRRSTATWLTSLLVIVGASLILFVNDLMMTRAIVMVAYLLVLALVIDVMRYIFTENMVLRVQLLMIKKGAA